MVSTTTQTLSFEYHGIYYYSNTIFGISWYLLLLKHYLLNIMVSTTIQTLSFEYHGIYYYSNTIF